MRTVTFLAALVAGLASFPAAAPATPSSVSAWYVYGSSPAELASYAYARGCEFAKSQPGSGLRLMLLDFGAARKLSSGAWGTIDFSNSTVSNADILAALKRAADGYHNCHVRGAADIVYGNSNYRLSASGMSTSDAWYAGYHQSERSEDLSDYQAANGYDSQTSDAASDMEPSWDGRVDHEATRERRPDSGMGAVLRLRLGRRLPAERERRRAVQQRLARQ